MSGTVAIPIDTHDESGGEEDEDLDQRISRTPPTDIYFYLEKERDARVVRDDAFSDSEDEMPSHPPRRNRHLFRDLNQTTDSFLPLDTNGAAAMQDSVEMHE